MPRAKNLLHLIEHTPVPHLRSYLKMRPSYQERTALGKATRQQVSRSAQSVWAVTPSRPEPVDILLRQARTRIPELVPIRHQRMAASPFAFYRGGAAIMAHDLAKSPCTNIHVQLCGDMHVSNFGFFATTEHQLVFGISDFDETLPGSWEWDLKRLVASAVIAAESIGADKVYAQGIVRNIVTSYRRHLLDYAQMPYLQLAHEYIDDRRLRDTARPFGSQAQQFIRKQIAYARDNTNFGVLKKFTHMTNGRRQITDRAPLIERAEISHTGGPMEQFLDQVLVSYADSLLSDRRQLLKRYRLVDFARQVVGVGSVGLSCLMLYMTGIDDQDPLFLQYKQAESSVLAPYLGDPVFTHQGHRVAAGQRLIQGAPDMLLGYGQTKSRQFYVRQLRDMKGGISFGPEGVGKKEFPAYAHLFGWALALAHARSGDPAILSGYCGTTTQLDDAMCTFAFAYARQNAVDFETFTQAVKQGKVRIA